MRHVTSRACVPMILCALAGCASTETSQGRVEIVLEGEDGIRAGLTPGSADEDIRDGWTVSFDKYIVAISDIEVGGGGPTQRRSEAIVLDLSQVESLEIADLQLAAGSWTEVSYRTPVVTTATMRDPSVSQADFQRMVTEGCTYLIEGTLTKPDGQRCPPGTSTCTPVTSVRFDLCVPAATAYGPCESDTGIEGLVVTANGTTTAALTIHGDHLFFNGFPEGAEGSTERRAQWLADVPDQNGNALLDRADLEAMTASMFGELFDGYMLGGAPSHLLPLDSAFEYVQAQLSTQGHFQGEGECPWGPVP